MKELSGFLAADGCLRIIKFLRTCLFQRQKRGAFRYSRASFSCWVLLTFFFHYTATAVSPFLPGVLLGGVIIRSCLLFNSFRNIVLYIGPSLIGTAACRSKVEKVIVKLCTEHQGGLNVITCGLALVLFQNCS